MFRVYRCDICGKVTAISDDRAGVPVCCGQPMTQVMPNVVEASQEKHLPDVQIDENIVHIQVGSVPHPMTKEHYIEFIVLETTHGFKELKLSPGESPKAAFMVAAGEVPINAFAYCNLHGLWKTPLGENAR